MKAVVCGAGRVGYGIARALSREGNSVTVVDWSPELINKITTDLDVRGVVGHGSAKIGSIAHSIAQSAQSAR